MSLTLDWLSGGPVEPSFDPDRLRAALRGLDAIEIDGLIKGFPPDEKPMMLSAIGGRAWNLLGDDLPFPVAVLKRSALEHNARWMQAYQDRHGVSLAPHAKTTMAPHLWLLQAGANCWGLTVATVQQARVAVSFGCRNLILANEVMGHANLAGLMDLHRADPQVNIMVFVESEAGVRALVGAMRACGCERPLDVLLELGMKGGRAGCRDIGMVDRILDTLAGERDLLRLVGMAGFEGIVKGDDDPRLEAFLNLLEESAALADRRNVLAGGAVILSAGGSAYFDLITKRLMGIRLSRPTRVILRSGCYLTHDSHHYEQHQLEMRERSPEQFTDLDRLIPSLFVWGIVQANPEPGLVILSMGKRDVGFDIDLPRPVWRYRHHKMTRPVAMTGAEVFALNDQHAYMRVAIDADIAVGDLIGCGVSHPCTTLDRWRLLHVVNDDWISVGAIMTFF